ncbi:MAG: hypothetical protein WEC12_06315, partial [Balneolaceae bacterium]
SLPNVIDVSEGIPFVHLTRWKHEELYSLKGDIVSRGVKAVTGFDLPVFPKRRFQHGVAEEKDTAKILQGNETEYRNYFSSLYGQ